jgi:hypothetical protein
MLCRSDPCKLHGGTTIAFAPVLLVDPDIGNPPRIISLQPGDPEVPDDALAVASSLPTPGGKGFLSATSGGVTGRSSLILAVTRFRRGSEPGGADIRGTDPSGEHSDEELPARSSPR